MKTKITVNRHKIAKNKKTASQEPVLSCRTYKSLDYANEIEIKGPCRLIYSPEKPLSCGATVYITTESEVIKIR